MKINFKILQLKNITSCGHSFRDWQEAKEKFDLTDYSEVFNGSFDSPTDDINSICDILFRQFNRVTEEDCKRLEEIGFKGHSLSRSDVISLEHEQDVAHYCDAFGWKRINL